MRLDQALAASQSSNLFSGHVSRNVGGLADRLPVVLPSFSTTHEFEVSWPIYDGSRLPEKSDPVLVVFPPEGEPWALWSPTEREPSEGITGPEGPQGPEGPIGPEGPRGEGSYDTSPIGSLMTWSGRSSPSAEYALANGQTLSKFDFPDGYSFAVAEESLGNPDWTTTSTTFTVPNYVGRFLFHRKAGQSQGVKTGDEQVTLGLTQMPAHRHEMHITNLGPFTRGTNTGIGHGSGTSVNSDTTPSFNGGRTSSVGGGLPHNNMPPYVAVAFFVKVAGVSISGGTIQGPAGADGTDGAPGGGNGYFVEETSGIGEVTIPDTGAAGDFLVTGHLMVQSAGAYYVTADVEISDGSSILWSSSLTVSDFATYMPLPIALPQQVLATGVGVPLTLSAYVTGGYPLETRLSALAFNQL